MSKVRIAVAGAGLIGRRHAELIHESKDCELSALVDPAAGTSEFAEQLGVPLYRTLNDLFSHARPDGVIIATPNALHGEQGLECVRHRVAMLVEKPIADSIDDAKCLIETADRERVSLLVGHHRRHSPILAQARAVVNDGSLGPIVAVIGSAMFYKPDGYFDQASWRRQPGGGPILINMIHEVDNLRWLCGEIIAVQAFSSNATRGFPVEDTVAINLSFASGALGTFMLSDTAASSRSWEQTSRENKSYAYEADEDCYAIVGTRGSLAVPTMRLKTYPEERSWWKPFATEVMDIERADPLARQLEHFCAVIRGQAAPLVSGHDALKTLQVTLAIDRAARTGQIVTMD